MVNPTKTAAIVVAGGRGSRAGKGQPKQYRLVSGKPMIWHSVEAFCRHPAIDAVFVVIGEGQDALAATALEGLDVTALIPGGCERRESVRNGLEYIDKQYLYSKVLIHDAARPFLSAMMIDALLGALETHEGAVPGLPVADSLARSDNGTTLKESADRSGLWRIQTPQAFRHDVILAAHRLWNDAIEASDDARMAMAAGHEVAIIPGDERLAKYTFASDFAREPAQSRSMPAMRTGTGFDVHRLATGEELWLCGVKIAHNKGLIGHSDADVALHALTDAILGAAGLGDIGEHFPPSDPQWRGVASSKFVRHAIRLAAAAGYGVANVDVTIICEAPKIGPHKQAMRERVADMLGIDSSVVNIKATTTEGLGYTGREEGIAAQAVATLEAH